jgi:hypothetical protein
MKKLLAVILLLPLGAAAQELNPEPVYRDLPTIAEVCWKPELTSPYIGESHADAVNACMTEETRSKALAETILNGEPLGLGQRLAVVDCHMGYAVGKQHGWPFFYFDLVTCPNSAELIGERS